MNQKNKNLAQFFPIIRTKEQILSEITDNEKLNETFSSWRTDQREEFLSICTGSKGVKMLYDSYFKEILNPESTPERLSYLLTILLKRQVTVKYALTNDNSRLGDEMSLVITDIVVELDDGTIANIEVQKLGFAFTGERASCYSADLLLRQYKRIRDKHKEKFTYKDICPVYTIVFLEKSPEEFKKYSDHFIHYFSATSNTGIRLNLLQNFIFIPVDIFLEKLHNEGINGELEAWLTFLGCDEPEYIVKLIEEYPYFKPLYNDLYSMCLNTERVINMFSEELKILDKNTITYMIDEMQDELNKKQSELDIVNIELDNARTELDTAKNELDTTKTELDTAKTELDTAKSELDLASSFFPWLINNGRLDDAQKASQDSAFYEKLFLEYKNLRKKNH